MDIHRHARWTPQSRVGVVRRVVAQGQTPPALGSYCRLGSPVRCILTDHGGCYCAATGAPLHQALHATDQRLGRALSPDRAVRGGLRLRLGHLGPATGPSQS